MTIHRVIRIIEKLKLDDDWLKRIHIKRVKSMKHSHVQIGRVN